VRPRQPSCMLSLLSRGYSGSAVLTRVWARRASGTADGMFADKWSYQASQVNETTWKICNNRCGFISPAQAAAYNAGAIKVREQISALMHMNSTTAGDFGGLLYADGLSNGAKCPKAVYPDGSVKINLVGPWAMLRPELGYTTHPYEHLSGPDKETTVMGLLRMISQYLDPACGYKYIYLGCGDHSNNAHYVSKALDPLDLDTDCSSNHHALVLLVVQPGVFLGANGWADIYDRKLGDPLGPAKNATHPATGSRILVRNFTSGTSVVWDLEKGVGVIDWAGFPPSPPPPMPPAPPPPPPPPPPPAPSDKCKFVDGRDYHAGFIAKVSTQTQAECCGACLSSHKKTKCEVAVFVPAAHECFLKASTAQPINNTKAVSCQPKQ
jgi:hypothetical protein